MHEVFVEYQLLPDQSIAKRILWDWARNHKTMVVLNGGNTKDLRELYLQIRYLGDNLNLPYSAFNEDEASLNSALTCVGIVVPENIYNGAAVMRNGIDSTTDQVVRDQFFSLKPEEKSLAELLNQFGLAK
jgi:hypothetical protein